jgi:hypothetical protein
MLQSLPPGLPCELRLLILSFLPKPTPLYLTIIQQSTKVVNYTGVISNLLSILFIYKNYKPSGITLITLFTIVHFVNINIGLLYNFYSKSNL